MRFLVICIFIMISSNVYARELPITETLVQKTNQVLDTYIGGQIFKVKRTSPLPNAFGSADIFGRKVDRGYLELRYLGKTDDGYSKFRVIDVETSSNETTMTRTNISFSSISGHHTYNPFTNSLNSQDNIVTIRPSKGSTKDLPPNTTEFELDTDAVDEIEFGRVKVRFGKTTPTSIKFMLISN